MIDAQEKQHLVLSELIRTTPTALEAAWARSDATLIPAWACMACFTYLALDAPDQAARELERAHTVWQQDEVTVQDLQLVICGLMPGTYRGDARSTWKLTAPQRARVRSSFFARVAFSGATDAWSCGAAVAASTETSDRSERPELLAEAERCAKRARRAFALPTGSPPGGRHGRVRARRSTNRHHGVARGSRRTQGPAPLRVRNPAPPKPRCLPDGSDRVLRGA